MIYILLRVFVDISRHFVFPAPNMEQSMYESPRPVFQGQRKPSACITHTENRTTRFLVSSLLCYTFTYKRMTPFSLISFGRESHKRKDNLNYAFGKLKILFLLDTPPTAFCPLIFIFSLFFSSICSMYNITITRNATKKNDE